MSIAVFSVYDVYSRKLYHSLSLLTRLHKESVLVHYDGMLKAELNLVVVDHYGFFANHDKRDFLSQYIIRTNQCCDPLAR